MSIVECVIAEQQPSISRNQTGNSPGSPYFVIALAAVLLGVIVLIVIRAKAPRRSSKR
jgi:hypothetical protein